MPIGERCMWCRQITITSLLVPICDPCWNVEEDPVARLEREEQALMDMKAYQPALLSVWEYAVTCPRCSHPIKSPSRRFAWRVAEIVAKPRCYCRRCKVNLTVEVPR